MCFSNEHRDAGRARLRAPSVSSGSSGNRIEKHRIIYDPPAASGLQRKRRLCLLGQQQLLRTLTTFHSHSHPAASLTGHPNPGRVNMDPELGTQSPDLICLMTFVCYRFNVK